MPQFSTTSKTKTLPKLSAVDPKTMPIVHTKQIDTDTSSDSNSGSESASESDTSDSQFSSDSNASSTSETSASTTTNNELDQDRKQDASQNTLSNLPNLNASFDHSYGLFSEKP